MEGQVARSAAAVAVGASAPDFELRDQHNQPVRLSDFRGKKHVLLVFYPWAFSTICQGELQALEEALADFLNDDTHLLAVSVDSHFALRRWAAEQGFQFPLLSDFWPHGEVARRYGIFDERTGAALRGTFLVDRAGIVRWEVVHGIPEARDLQEYRDALAALEADEVSPRP
jgi:mycoredoxin-dependent peroxiredoxin